MSRGGMGWPDSGSEVVDAAVLDRARQRLREADVVLPTFAELADPSAMAPGLRDELDGIDPDAPHPRNLFRVHWHNARDRRGTAAVPEHLVLTEELTGVRSPILVAIGRHFPLIRAHKVLAAYACLAPRLATGAFDPGRQRAVWPSTGNYCRGGVAIARILGCRGVAVLPEGMSAERFEWLERWVADPADVIRTPGTESNVKEIYDECRRLARDPEAVILNQFAEVGNHLAHVAVTAPAIERVFRHVTSSRPGLSLAAFVSATGSAGTLGAGDVLKERLGARIVAAEALECPTLLYNGYGEHNIQGIGDKHVPLIHNVMNTDVVAAVSDRSTDQLLVLFNTTAGRDWLRDELGLEAELVTRLADLGLSSICNVLASILVAKRLGLRPDQAIATVATDGAELYRSEVDKAIARHFRGHFGAREAARTFETHLRDLSTEHVLPLAERDRQRIFNLGYFTWVEQQGIPLEDFERRRDPKFWRGLRALLPAWDERIRALNAAAHGSPAS